MNSFLPATFVKFLIISVLFLGQDVLGQVVMSETGSYSQNFNTLASTGASYTWIDNSTILNWYSQRTGTGTNYAVSTGSSTAGNLYSFGSTSSPDRALGTIGSGNAAAGSFSHGVLLLNNSGSTITDLTVTYTLEQWRKENNASEHAVTFWYKISSSAITSLNTNNNGTWTQVTALTATSPIYSATTAVALDGNLSSNRVTLSNVSIPGLSIANNEYIMLKWEDPDHSGSDHGLAIDDVTINWTVSAPVPTVTTTSNVGLIDTTNAFLTGTINANGTTTLASFEYGTSITYGNSETATPATVTGSTTTNIDLYISSLTPNTQYFYRAVGTVDGIPTNGNNLTFYTLAVTPGVPVLNNPQFNSLDVTLDSATQNGNPSATEYAIQEFGGQFIQADGTLGVTEVWQTAAVWGTITVTGLTASTNYTFQVKARNSENVETALGASASATTLTPETVDYAVVQFPNTTQTITEGDQITVYIRAYENGITTPAGFSPRLKAWVGYSLANDNPANVGWTWIPATFNVQVGNDDEYQANIGNGLTPGTYYYAARFEIDDSGVFVYGGSSGNWNNNNVTLNVNADVVNYANIQFPSSAAITQGSTVTIYAQVYEPGVTEGAGQGAGITAEIGYSTTNSTPDETWTWLSTTHNASETGNNDEYQVNLGDGLSPGTYYYASRFIKTGSNTYVYGGTNGSPWTTSGVLTVNALDAPIATAATLIGQTQFTANWLAVSSATGYRLDVSTNENFQTINPQILSEGFTNYSSQGSFEGFTMTGTGNYTTTASSGSTGPNSIQFNDTNDQLVSPSFPNALTSLSFWIKGNGTNSVSSFLIEGYNGTSWQTIQNITNSIPTTGTVYNYTSSTSPALPNNITQIRFTYTKSVGNLAFDDFSVSYNEMIPLYTIENLNVGNVTSYQVTGLDPNTTYYYRVRAENNSISSANSNVISVTTKPSSVIWNGTEWSVAGGPDETIDAIINGPYNTSNNGVFVAKSLHLQGGSLTVSSGTSITVVNEIINELNATDVVVESNANIVQVEEATNSGEITVNRNSSELMRLDYTLWSAPVSGQGLLSFSPNTMVNRFYTYNPLLDIYQTIDPNVNSFQAGTGYLIRMPNNHPTTPTTWSGTFVGELNNGTLTLSVNNNTYNAVGNPYPSTISADEFINNNNLTGALYFWRKTNGAAGSAYATYTLAGGAGTGTSGSNDQVPNGIIQVGQGFIALSTSTSLVFNNQMRVADNNNQFFRNANNLTKSRIWLNLNQENEVLGQTMVGYMEGTTTNFDPKYDGKYINDSQTAITSVINNDEYAVQARGEFVTTDVVPLTIKLETSGNYSISLAQVDGVFSTEHDILLKDVVLGLEHDLRNAPYSFSSNEGVFSNRFELVYQSTLSLENPVLSNNFVVYTQEKNMHVMIQNTTISEVKVMDIRGRIIKTEKDINNTLFTADLSALANQVLIVQVKTAEGEWLTRKIAL